ncbi:hypothetical protein NQD34_016521 [Periophthalmus magnuspinnatus]|nr:hypothetical protein NQD34_016521 [Periophthalmus magnuspinnatus]
MDTTQRTHTLKLRSHLYGVLPFIFFLLLLLTHLDQLVLKVHLPIKSAECKYSGVSLLFSLLYYYFVFCYFCFFKYYVVTSIYGASTQHNSCLLLHFLLTTPAPAVESQSSDLSQTQPNSHSNFSFY